MNYFEERYQEKLSKEAVETWTKKTYLCNKSLIVEHVERGIVLPPKHFEVAVANKLGLHGPIYGKGGVVNSKGEYVALSAQKAVGMRQRVSGGYRYNTRQLVQKNEKVIYLNYFIKQWGHFLLDVIGRVWYPLLEDQETKIVYTCYQGEDTKLVGNYLEFFKLLGIEEERLLLVNQPTQFSEIIIPESAILPGSYYTKEYKLIFDKLVSAVELIGDSWQNQKIYCSRSRFNLAKSKEFGEDGIEKVFIDNGYSPIHMETMTLSEQIRTLMTAKSIVLTSGSLAHNLLFLRQQTEVFILNKTYRLNFHQFLINEISEGKITMVDIYKSPLPILYGYGPFLMDITRPFSNFLNDYHFQYDLRSVLTNKDYFRYYCRWLWNYKFFLFRLNSIREGDSEFEISFRDIRDYYKAVKNEQV